MIIGIISLTITEDSYVLVIEIHKMIDNYLLIEAALRKSNLRLDAVRRYRHGPAKPARIPDESR